MSTEAPLTEIIEELSPKDLKAMRKIGLFLLECRIAKRQGQFIGHIDGNGVLVKVDLKREEQIRL